MKKIIRPILISSLALVALVAWLTGCALHNYDAGMATGKSLQESADKIAAGQGKIDVTLASLNDLVNNPQPDLRPQYSKFSDNVDDLDSSAKDVKDTVTTMRERGKKFIAQWEEQSAQIQNENIRNLSSQRKQEVADKLMAVKTSYAKAEMAFKPLMSDLRDIQKYLSTDLTTGGIAAIKPTAAKVSTDADNLKGPLADLTSQFKDLGVSMSAVKPQPPQ
jgi:chromosome segregation ATPase